MGNNRDVSRADPMHSSLLSASGHKVGKGPRNRALI